MTKERKPIEKQDYSNLNGLERAIHRGFISAGVKNVTVTIIKETAQECLAQMKPVEWSEEDEKHLNWIIEHFKQGVGLYDNLIYWLTQLHKRFNSQPHWKPSEEQMEALETGIENTQHLAATHFLLVSLYDDLKSL